jgi:hypothetical protein
VKKLNKLFLGTATVVTLISPLVPKNIYINLNREKVESQKLISSQCDLSYTSVTENGMQVCEYHCRAGNKATIYKTFRSNAVSCPDTTTERVQQSKK